jgi:formate C-acetyltransferase
MKRRNFLRNSTAGLGLLMVDRFDSKPVDWLASGAPVKLASNRLTDLIPVLREMSINQDNRSTFIDRERILREVIKDDLPSVSPSKHYTHSFCRLMERVSTPVNDNDVILGRAVEGKPEGFTDEELEKIISVPWAWKHTVVNFIIGGPGHLTLNYGTLIYKGLKGIAEEAEETANKLKTPVAKRFAANTRECCEAVKVYAGHYSKAAREKAAAATDPFLSGNYLRAADALDKVPYQPAYDYFSALQSIWLMHFIVSSYIGSRDVGFGRLDQFLFPFYETDIKSGRIDRDTAVGYMAHFLEKSNEIIGTQGAHYRSRPVASEGSKMYIILAGLSGTGKEMHNDLSRVVLEAAQIVRLTEPVIIVRMNPGYSRDFINYAVAAAKNTQGQVQFYNDDIVVKGLMNAGIPKTDAIEYTANGCSRIDLNAVNIGYEQYFSPVNWFMWMLDGAPGKLEIGLGYMIDIDKVNRNIDSKWRPAAKNNNQYKSIDEIIESFGLLSDAIMEIAVTCCDAISEPIYQHHLPLVENAPHYHFESVLLDDCVKNGKTYCEGGMRYSLLTCWYSGLANLTDSLVSMNRLVFESKRFTLDQLMDICRDNFTGQADLHLEILNNFPKYGNDNEEADTMACKISNRLVESIERAKAVGKNHYMPGFYSLANNLILGKILIATPDGRLAGEPLSENLSPSYGSDISGPTALLKSVAKLPLHKASTGCLNMKFNTRTNPETISSLLYTFFSLGGFHIGMTFADKRTLIDAYYNPRNHRNLFVRQHGFTEYFVGLQPDEQVDMIRRTEY